jgi:hypothetical protein
MTLLILLAGAGSGSVLEQDGDVSLSDSTLYNAALTDGAPYALSVADSTIYAAGLSDAEEA